MVLRREPGYRYSMSTSQLDRGKAMKPSIRGKLLLGAIMALALSSYVAITANASKAVGAGIYEVAASNLSYAELVGTGHVKGANEMKRLAFRTRR